MRFFGVNFILPKFCQCKKNDKYQVWTCETCSCLWMFWLQRLLPSCFTCNQILSKYPPEYHLFIPPHTWKWTWLSCLHRILKDSVNRWLPRKVHQWEIFFSIRSYTLFDFSDILGLLCPGSSIWFYLHRIDFRTGRRSPKCCWCFIAASLSQGVFATTEILTFTSKH